MTIRMDSLIRIFANALDIVEIDFLGASTNHGKRIAVLCAAMGQRLGMSRDAISDLVSCALLHDNALTEFILLENDHSHYFDNYDFGQHCIIGQRNIENLSFKGSVDGLILYHHERADGLGLFKLAEGDFPIGAEFIAAADMIDVEYRLGQMPSAKLPELRKNIKSNIHRRFTKNAGNALLDVLDEDMLSSLRNKKIKKTVDKVIPAWTMAMDNPALISIAEFISHIIDFKSIYTKIHTQQIANRVWSMAEYYGYSMQEKIQLYLAAALHDIGKLAVPSVVLEKPGKLNDKEFEIIKTHMNHGWSILGEMDGLNKITQWALNHHETLDGNGYPRGIDNPGLDFNSRLMACIDIYQAVSEERPYHPRRNHEETIPILYKMAKSGKIDTDIVKDLDKVMANWSGKKIELRIIDSVAV